MRKGVAFLQSATLLAAVGGDGWVRMHLLAQGIELTLKALLLANDYDRYRKQLPTRRFGHDLLALESEVVRVFGARPLRTSVASELASLDRHYGQHALRYAGIPDIFIEPTTIGTRRLERKLAALQRVIARKRVFEPWPW